MKKLLAVGINTYHPKFGNIDLKQCVADIDRVISTLPNVDEVCRLTNSDATKSEILVNIKYYASDLKVGDTFIYYHSGHGTSSITDNKTNTGRVAYDDVLWDFEILDALSYFEKGVSVIILSDTCHSESNSKSVLPEGFTVKSAQVTIKPKVYKTNKVKASVYAIAACKFDGVSLETSKGGMFTNAFLSVYQTPATWKQLVKSIKDLTGKYQTPVLETIKAKTTTQHLV